MTLKEFLHNNRPTVFFVIAFILSITFLTSDLTSYLKTIRSFCIYFFSSSYIPVQNVINYPVEQYNKFVKIIYLYEENLKMKEQLKKLYLYKLKYEQLKNDCLRYEEFSEIKDFTNFKLLNCRIVSREYMHWYNYFIISKGKKSGIKEDLPVLLNYGLKDFFLIGRIWTTEDNISKVLLITDPLSGIPAKIKGKPIQGIVLGNGTPKPVMEYILLEDPVTIGDTVVTSNLISSIPENIEIGTVVSIEPSSTTGFKKVVVALKFNINNLKDVNVLLQ